MTEIGESAAGGGSAGEQSIKILFAALLEIRFDSGIDLHDVDATGAIKVVPPSGRPHWGDPVAYPSAHVRQGGKGETKTLKAKVSWIQEGYDGSATLKGKSSDGEIEIEGTVSISGALSEAVVDCTFKKKPSVVRNYNTGLVIEWTLEVSGGVHTLANTPLRLFFVDAKPKPVGWSYPKHYLLAVHFATQWSEGKTGAGPVFTAIWSKFKGPQVPHATGWAYWHTNNPTQNLKDAFTPGVASKRGWSCRAIAHLFMECLALHDISCTEVIPEVDPNAQLFLVKNWSFAAAPKNSGLSGRYYGGTWTSIPTAPLNKPVRSTLLKYDVDCTKKPGVPAQGQPMAPLGFCNHWIVLTQGKLHDTSYGSVHPNDLGSYAKNSIDGWLRETEYDEYTDKLLGTESADAWVTTQLEGSGLRLVRNDAASN